MNPIEIDTQIAALVTQYTNAKQGADYAVSSMRNITGEKAVYQGKKRVFLVPSLLLIERVREMAAAHITHNSYHCYLCPINAIQRYDAAVENMARIEREIDALEAEFTAAPWSRFFLVTSSEGHIHSSRHCSSCNSNTEYDWLPQLSGKTEAEAVADQGPRLCSICFPTAPVAWTTGKPKAKTGQCVGGFAKNTKRVYNGQQGDCPSCTKKKIWVNDTGLVRWHKAL